MTDTPRPTPADLQAWRREAQAEVEIYKCPVDCECRSTRILALLDALDESVSEVKVRENLTMEVMFECIHGDMNGLDWKDHIRNTVVAALLPKSPKGTR